MRRELLIFVIILISSAVYAQSKQFRFRVLVKPKHCVYKVIDSAYKDTAIFNAGTTLLKRNVVTNGSITYQVDSTTNLIKSDTLIIDKKKQALQKVDWKNYSSSKAPKATITQSKDTLLINFWITPQDSCKKRHYGCNVCEDTNALFKNKDKYVILLENRQYVSFLYSNWEMGALSTPIKYRFKTEKNGINVDPSISSDVANIGLYVGLKLGKTRYWYNKYETTTPSKWGITLGPFLGINSEKLDTTKTNASKVPLKKDETRDVVAASYGIAVLFDVYDFRLALHVGSDHAFGQNKELWNYQDKIWIGLGIGYKLTIFQKRE